MQTVWINGLVHLVEVLERFNDASQDQELEPECRCLCVSGVKNYTRRRPRRIRFRIV